jgi:hypothetical protein
MPEELVGGGSKGGGVTSGHFLDAIDIELKYGKN